MGFRTISGAFGSRYCPRRMRSTRPFRAMFPMARKAWVAGELKPLARAILVASRVVIRPPDFRPCWTMASWRVRFRERGIWMPCWRQRPRSSSRDSDGVRRTCPGSTAAGRRPGGPGNRSRFPEKGRFSASRYLGCPGPVWSGNAPVPGRGDGPWGMVRGSAGSAVASTAPAPSARVARRGSSVPDRESVRGRAGRLSPASGPGCRRTIRRRSGSPGAWRSGHRA